MPQIKPEWRISEEAQKIVERLCQLYPERYGHIDAGSIGCVSLVNKDRSGRQPDSKLKGFRMPEALFSNKLYIINFYESSWQAYTPAQRSAMILKNLDRIPDTEDGPDGSVLAEDLKDNRTLVKEFGVDYMESNTLPDFAAAKHPLGPREVAEEAGE